METKYAFGWKKQPEDARDKKYQLTNKKVKDKVDLRGYCSKIETQLNLGACTAFSTSAGILMVAKRNRIPDMVTPSKLFMYYISRKMDQSTAVDTGAYIRDVFKAINYYGFCDEKDYPYIVENFAVEPTLDTYRLAQQKNISYHAVDQTLPALMHCLSSGKPIIFGFSVYSGMYRKEVTDTGMLPYPDFNKEVRVGGHAVVLVGYDASKELFIVRNSWGEEWGEKGYFYMPFKYVLDPELSSDFWTIDIVE